MKSPEVKSHRRLLKASLLAAGAVLMLTSCDEDKPLVQLTETQHNNLKESAGRQIKDLFAGYRDSEMFRADNGLHAYHDDPPIKTTGEVSGKALKFESGKDASVKFELAADGIEMTVNRGSYDYCVDRSGDIVDQEDCLYESPVEFMDEGYEATYINPSFSHKILDKPVAMGRIMQFVKHKDTYLASIGDEYGTSTLRITADGDVTEEGYVAGTDTPEDTLLTLSNMASRL